jgi:hypothetical protein
MTKKVVEAAREVIRARLEPTTPLTPPPVARERSELQWSFEVVGLNSIRLDAPALTIVDRPSRAELSVQHQLVQKLSLNGGDLDWRSAAVDQQFDLSYRRLDVTDLLQVGENRFVVETAEPKPLKFLPALILWGDFAVDRQGRLITPPKTIALGDWRQRGYPALCGAGRYHAVTNFETPPAQLTVDTGGYPVRVMMNGKHIGLRAWPPFRFDLRSAARKGRNEIAIEVASTVGHLFVPSESSPVGLLAAEFVL